MHRLSTSLDGALQKAKFPVGPTKFRPGPMLERRLTTLVKVVSRSYPSTVSSKNAPKANRA